MAQIADEFASCCSYAARPDGTALRQFLIGSFCALCAFVVSPSYAPDSAARRRCSAKCSRERTVPTGTSSTAAISS